MTPLFDTHAHLHDPGLADGLEAILERARGDGVERIVTIGTDRPTSRAAVALAEAYAGVWATIGMHPHDAKDWDGAAEDEFRRLAEAETVVAVGEIGLDFYRNLSPHEDQYRAFEEQLELADELGLPVVIHSRDAHEETYAALSEWAAARPRDWPFGVIHCFSGDAKLALRYWELGFLISFAGPVTYPKNDALRQAAAALPLEAVVLETDCPYLTPQPRRGKRNEPSYVRYTAECVAEARGEGLETVAEASVANGIRLFRL